MAEDTTRAIHTDPADRNGRLEALASAYALGVHERAQRALRLRSALDGHNPELRAELAAEQRDDLLHLRDANATARDHLRDHSESVLDADGWAAVRDVVTLTGKWADVDPWAQRQAESLRDELSELGALSELNSIPEEWPTLAEVEQRSLDAEQLDERELFSGQWRDAEVAYGFAVATNQFDQTTPVPDARAAETQRLMAASRSASSVTLSSTAARATASTGRPRSGGAGLEL